jgi:hypothetical protein
LRLSALIAGSLGALLGATGLAFGVGPLSAMQSQDLHERQSWAFHERPSGDERPGSYAQESTATGPGQSAEEAISQVLKGTSGTEVRSASLMEAPADSVTTGPWVNVRVDSDKGDDLYAVWLGGLVQGAVADQMRDDEETTADVIGGGQVEDTDQSGAPVTVSLGTGSIVGGQVFHSPSDDELEARMKTAARRFGLELLAVEVMHPLESAISVRFALPEDGELSWTIDDLRDAVAGSPLSVEGVFIEIDSPSGKSLLRTGTSYRTGEGGLSFAPGQDDRFGALHGHLGSLAAVK